MSIRNHLRRHHPKSGTCEECNGTGRATEYSLIHGRDYSTDRIDYRELCTQCHHVYDGTRPIPPVGESHYRAKLNEGIVRDVRARHDAGESGASLAREYGITRSAMSKVLRGKMWKHVGAG